MNRFACHRPLLMILLCLVSCVTINIYFPAEEVRHAADQIVEEVWGSEERHNAPAAQKETGSFLYDLLGPAAAHADQDINVSTPAIRSIKQSIQSRAGELKAYMSSGAIGLGSDGLLKVRGEGLDLKQRAAVNKLVEAENRDRQKLYKEIAKANGFPDKVGEVQAIFAKSWMDQAQAGWFIERGGKWVKK